MIHIMSSKTSGKHVELPVDVTDMIRHGNTFEAMGRLGKAYSLTGRVVEGNKIGRTLGYPTANLEASRDAVQPGMGVYTAMVHLNGMWYKSMVNVGIRPTLNLHEVTIEAHLFNFEGNIYGETISIHFLEKIRDEMRFNSLSELKQQLNADNEHARRAIANISQGIRLTDDNHCAFKSS
jgi:riboflavin kinase / FMN adenylyltransferase